MPALLLLLACGEFGLEEGFETALDSSAAGDCGADICITGVEPAFGPTSGGTTVQILGQGFGVSPTVWFGGAELSATVLGDGQLLVTSPAVAVAAPVDVTVDNGTEQAVAYNAFTYTDGGGDADTDADTDSDTDTDVTPTGKLEGLVEYSYMVYGCPECFGVSSQLSYSIGAVFHDPVGGSWLNDLPTQGSCATTSASTPPTSVYKDMGDWAYVSAGSDSIPLQKSLQGGSVIYLSQPLSESDKLWNSAYDLQVPSAGWEVSDVVETTFGFDTFQPLTILNPSNSAFTKLSRNGLTFTWSPAYEAESFIIWITVFNAQGNAVLGELYCHAEDNGGATIPSSLLTSYPSGALMSIQLMRRQGSQSVNPSTGNTIEGASYVGLVGTATLQ